MTENKRFTIDRFDLLEYGEPVTVEEACDLLNKLSNENKQLKQVISEFVENPIQHNLWKLRTILKDDVE